MKSFFLLTLFLFWGTAFAAETMGIGAMVGNPTGVNGKYWLNDDRAVDGGIGMSVGKSSHATIHSDYLLHNPGAFFFKDVHPLDLYYGIGGRMKFSDDIQLGVRVPVGLAHKVAGESADVFGEVAPIIDFIGRQGLEVSAIVGARYYFR